MVTAIVLFVCLGISVFFNLSDFANDLFLGGSGRYSHSVGPRIDEVLVDDNNSVNKIAIIDVDGLITSRVLDQGGFSMVEVIQAQLRCAAQDDNVKAVILKVDSPGGEVLASDDIYRALAKFQKTSGKPVIASMGDLAASGGYYVSTPCRWIVANPLTLTGSIGVIIHTWNYRGLMDKLGLEPEVYKSGKFKDMLSGEREPSQVSPEEKEMLNSLIQQTFARFKEVVGEGRRLANQENKGKGQALAADWTKYADGRVLSGQDAYKLGFVDELGDFHDAVRRAKTIAGIPNANLIEYQQRYGLTDLFHLFGKAEAKPIKIDWGFDLPKLQAGQPYYLAPMFLR